LEDLLDRRILRVTSTNVSREAVRWHVLCAELGLDRRRAAA
jgi:hypothetical protein